MLMVMWTASIHSMFFQDAWMKKLGDNHPLIFLVLFFFFLMGGGIVITLRT